MSENDLDLKYELPILDIIACVFALIAILLAMLTIYLSNETRKNTERTANDIETNNKQMLLMTEILRDIRENTY